MLTKLNKKRDEKGFTLIELMIVIAIIGILAAIAIPQFAAYRERAYVSALKSDAHSFANAQEAYFADHGLYCMDPTVLTGATYGAEISQHTSAVVITSGAVAIEFYMTLTDSLHNNIQVSYDSDAGGLL